MGLYTLFVFERSYFRVRVSQAEKNHIIYFAVKLVRCSDVSLRREQCRQLGQLLPKLYFPLLLPSRLILEQIIKLKQTIWLIPGC